MRKIILAAFLFTAITCTAQKVKKRNVYADDSIKYTRLSTKDSITKIKDTTVLIVMKPKEYTMFMNWIDNLNAPHREVKEIEKFIADRLKVIK